MNRSAKTIWLAMILISLTVAACGPGGTSTGNALVDIGNERRGRVVAPADDGASIVGVAEAEVRIGSTTVRTDDQGFWLFEAEEFDSSTVTVYKEGYAPLSKAFDTRSRFVQTELSPVHLVQEITVNEESVLVYDEDQDGVPDASVVIPASAIDTTHETVTASLTLVRPQLEEEFNRFPGTFQAESEDATSAQDLLRTFGTLDVSFSKNGALLPNGKLKEPASIQFALATGVNPDEITGTTVIPTWWLNLDTGIWKEEGEATLVQQNGTWLAQWDAKHFTWWNLDRPLEEHACLAVYVESSSEFSDASGITLHLRGEDYAGRSETMPLVLDEYVVMTGWKGHPVKLYAEQNGVASEALTNALAPADPSEGDAESRIYTLPNTSGSGIRDEGPDGGSLDPGAHCKLIKRTSNEIGIKQGVLHGRVTDAIGNPLSGATVYISETGQVANTNSDGYYGFEHVPWSDSVVIELEVDVVDHTNGDVIWTFAPQTVSRREAETKLNFVSTGKVDQLPVILSKSFSTTAPYSGDKVAFTIKVKDDSKTVTPKLAVRSGTHKSSNVYTDGVLTITGSWTAPSEVGSYDLTVDVSDSAGNTQRVAQRLTVSNPAPVVKLSGARDVSLGDTETYTLSVNDPNGDAMTVTLAVDGTTVFSGTGGASVPITFTTNGTHALKASVSDGQSTTQIRYVVTVSSVVVGSSSGDFVLQKLSERRAGNELSWDLVAGTTSYIVERAGQSMPTSFESIGTTTLTSYLDGTIGLSEGYVYRVRACVSGLCSISNTVSFAPVVFELSETLAGEVGAISDTAAVDDQHVFFTFGTSGARKFYLGWADARLPVQIDADGADNIQQCKVSPLASHVVCIAEFTASSKYYLYAFNVSTQSSVQLSPTLAGNQLVQSNFLMTPDDRYVIFQTGNGPNAPLYRNSLTGGTAMQLTSFGGSEEICPGGSSIAACPQLTYDNSRVVYTHRDSIASPVSIYSAPVTGGLSSLVSKPVTAGTVDDFKVDATSNGVLFRADYDTPNYRGLYYADAATGFVRQIASSGGATNRTVVRYEFAPIDGANQSGAVFGQYTNSAFDSWLRSSLENPSPVTIYSGNAWVSNKYVMTNDRGTILYRSANTDSATTGIFALTISTATEQRLSEVGGQSLNSAFSMPYVTERDELVLELDPGSPGQALYFHAPGMADRTAVSLGLQGVGDHAYADIVAHRYLGDDTLRLAFTVINFDAQSGQVVTVDLKNGAVADEFALTDQLGLGFNTTAVPVAWFNNTERFVVIGDDGNGARIYSLRAR